MLQTAPSDQIASKAPPPNGNSAMFSVTVSILP
jgi:hypothetical protein